MPRSVFNRAKRLAIFLAVGSLLLAFAPLQQAQEQPSPPPQLPSGPLLKSAPAKAQWLVEYKYADENPKSKKPPQPNPGLARSRIKQITTTRTLPLAYEEIIDQAGKKTEKWYANDEQYTRNAGSSKFFYAGDKDVGNPFYEYRSPTGFQGFEWISKKNYAGIQKVLDRDCLVFRDMQFGQATFDPNAAAMLAVEQKEQAQPKQDSTAATKGEPPAPNVPITACIDLVTRLPVVLQIGTETRVFTFLDQPAASVTLPSDLVKQLQQRSKTLNELTRRSPRPY